MEDSHDYFLQKMVDGSWKQVTKSYENTNLIETGKQLERICLGSYRVISDNGDILWQGKGAPSKENAPLNG